LSTNEEIDIFVKQNFGRKRVVSFGEVITTHQKAKENLENTNTISALQQILAKEI